MIDGSLDKIFVQFVKGIFILLILYGLGMMLVIALGKDNLALKLINVWSAMFSAVIGLGSGYLLGRSRTAYDNQVKETVKARKESQVFQAINPDQPKEK